jgi:hypothetical protein
MKRYCLLLFALPLMIATLQGAIVFDDPIPLFESHDLSLTHDAKVLPNGNILLRFSKHLQDIFVPHIQVFSADHEPVWEDAMPIPKLFDVAIHADGRIAVLREDDIHGYRLVLDTYDPAGNPVEELSNINSFYSHTQQYSRFATDSAGGVHFLACLNSLVRYMHIDAQGNLYSPQYGIDLMEGTYFAPSAFLPTPDGGVLVAIPRPDRLTVFKIGSDHELDWTTDFEDIHRASKVSLNLRNDSSFYVVWERSYQVFSNLMNMDGDKLWTEDLSPDSGSYQVCEGAAVDDLGNLILHYHAREGMFQMTGHHCLQVINPLGETVHSYTPGPESNMNNPYKMQIFPTAEGGWYLLAKEDEEPVYPEHFVQHYNSSYQNWQEPVLLDTGSQGDLYGYLNDNEFVAICIIGVEELRKIVVQKVDQQGNLHYPEPGAILLTGTRDTARQFQAISLSNGTLFVSWFQEHEFSDGKLVYQIISPSGRFYFPQAQVITEEPFDHYSIFETDNSEVLVAWQSSVGSNRRSFAQLISLGAGNLWEDGGRLLRQGQETHSYSFWNNSLYLASMCTFSGIYLHRYVDAYPVWAPEGIQVAADNPNYSSGPLMLSYFAENQISWSQSDSNFPQMGFTNFFFADGSTLYPPDQAMQAATDIPEPYVGAYIDNVHKSGDEMLFEMRYLFWEFYQEGHTDPGSWQITGSSFLQKAASDGSPIGDPIDFYPLPLLFHEDNVYYYNNTHGYIGILPLDGSPEANIPLEYGWRIDRLRAISDNKILINAYVNNSEGLTQQYAFIDENGIIEYPEYGEIADIKIQDIIVSDIGAWYLLNPATNTYYGTNAAYLQYLEWQTWGNDDPNVTPATSLSMQSFPNPFKGQTQICLKLNDPGPLTLKIYNLRGQLVQKIAHDNAVKGDNYLFWDGKDSSSRDCAAGIYFLRAESTDAKATIKTIKIN